jgi:glycosyltransferase involved in cell wall biosynthesis
MIQHSGHVLSPGLPIGGAPLSKDKAIDRLSRVVISVKQVLRPAWLATLLMSIRQFWGGKEKLTVFEPEHFKDFVWRALFEKTLHPDDFDTVTTGEFRVLQVPWTGMHYYGLVSNAFGFKRYAKLDTSEFDVFIAETPYPGRVSKNTRMIVRYHDAIPVLMPHTISDKKYHQAAHFNALKQNVTDGAWFSCVSKATRQDLLSIFPVVADRAFTIHNMISHHYFLEDSDPKRVPEIVRMRYNDSIKLEIKQRPELVTSNGTIDYLLAVSTIEPRKNHLTLLAAWERLRSQGYPNLKLVLVGMLGWDHAGIVKKFKPWMERGELFVLEDVPAPDLRVLYRHAACTVCPSFGEGFDFSGVEALRCGGRIAASHIAVHQEVYGVAATYFSPYSISMMSDVIRTSLSSTGLGYGPETQLNVSGDKVLRERMRDMILDVLKSR